MIDLMTCPQCGNKNISEADLWVREDIDRYARLVHVDMTTFKCGECGREWDMPTPDFPGEYPPNMDDDD